MEMARQFTYTLQQVPAIIAKKGVVIWLSPTTSSKYLINTLGMAKSRFSKVKHQ
jgi:hypothetical protein